jgi:hypothetical protein
VTLAEVEEAVQRIRDHADDDERAHGEEDGLRYAVLKAIAEGSRNARKLAAAALATDEIEFARWYA